MDAKRHYRFRPAQRLRKRSQYDSVYQFRRRFKTEFFVVNYRPNKCDFDRLGLTVSRKAGKAVTRNAIKRKIRELFRTRPDSARPHIDVVVRPERSFLTASFEELGNCWDEMLASVKKRLSGHGKR